MGVGAPEPAHVVSELIRSIFDVDKMLYFVAPEWWVPRLHRSRQQLGEEPPRRQRRPSGPPCRQPSARPRDDASRSVKDALVSTEPRHGAAQRGPPPTRTSIAAQNIVDWGGAGEAGRDNYYITEESEPAKLGSSLGWLLQLDGDNLRNALLNSPWVKAVIPIRVGKEQAAINWLRQAHVEGTTGSTPSTSPSPDDPPELHSTPGHTVTVLEALDILIDKIEAFDARPARRSSQPRRPEDPSNHFAGSLPTEAVFEHGFYPLQGGVRFNQGHGAADLLPVDGDPADRSGRRTRGGVRPDDAAGQGRPAAAAATTTSDGPRRSDRSAGARPSPRLHPGARPARVPRRGEHRTGTLGFDAFYVDERITTSLGPNPRGRFFNAPHELDAGAAPQP